MRYYPERWSWWYDNDLPLSDTVSKMAMFLEIGGMILCAIIYTLIFLVILHKRNKGEVKKKNSLTDLKILIQAFTITAYSIISNICWYEYQIFLPDTKYAYMVLNLLNIFSSAVNPIMYFTVNAAIRHNIGAVFSNHRNDHCFSNMQNIIFQIPVKNAIKICLVCGRKTHCLHYGILSCKSCKSSFRRIILSEKRFACSKPSLDSISHVLTCKACRFDRSLLLGMNPQALKVPDHIDRDAIVAEFIERKHFLLEKYKKENMPKAYLVLEEASEVKQLNSLLLTESRIKKVRESDVCLAAMMNNWTIEELILEPYNILADAENHTVKFYAF
uniref:Nuclear receptor domain-containing protein n=1 Tax=Ditylenchus dipsaci TaxID=166011 RepID=A0A915E783_9BILA